MTDREYSTKHILFEDSDEYIPAVIQDRNGQVALAMCKLCGAAESDLNEHFSCESYRAAAEIGRRMSDE